MPDPTLALHPVSLSLRQVADQIDQAVKSGYAGQDAVDRVLMRERARLAADLGFGEAAVAVALQDIATTLRGLEPVLRRGVEAHEREVAGVGAGVGVEEPAPHVSAPAPAPTPSAMSFWTTLGLVLQEPYRTPLAALMALVLGALLSWAGGQAGQENRGSDPAGQEESTPSAPSAPSEEPRPSVLPVSVPQHREEETP